MQSLAFHFLFWLSHKGKQAHIWDIIYCQDERRERKRYCLEITTIKLINNWTAELALCPAGYLEFGRVSHLLTVTEGQPSASLWPTSDLYCPPYSFISRCSGLCVILFFVTELWFSDEIWENYFYHNSWYYWNVKNFL